AGLLSPRERTVLAQARKAGYYDQPRKAGIAQVGAALKMPASTALYHLRAAQRKLVDDYLRR
ncbi:MAG: binding domain, partial [Thermoplasmata archaeon]|nr:binding domain [Thermoplasmata archaeon]